MASVQKLKANASKDSVWEGSGEISATGSAIELDELTGGANFVSFPASGNAGVTISANGMTADPETAAEAGYITIDVDGTSYQIPIYAA